MCVRANKIFNVEEPIRIGGHQVVRESGLGLDRAGEVGEGRAYEDDVRITRNGIQIDSNAVKCSACTSSRLNRCREAGFTSHHRKLRRLKSDWVGGESGESALQSGVRKGSEGG